MGISALKRTRWDADDTGTRDGNVAFRGPNWSVAGVGAIVPTPREASGLTRARCVQVFEPDLWGRRARPLDRSIRRVHVVRIRLQRLGRHNRPFYRINAVDKRTRRDGSAIEQLGWYDPMAKDPAKQLELNEERVKYWISVGAQPSETLRDVLAKRNLVDVAAWEKDREQDRKMVEAKKAAAAAAGEKKEEKKA
ncbi:MAG: 30S ribosomal protein S16 [Phycisphaerales bacterium]|nr:30S ribosomal protein S16 [Phycisphaerales bacterium]